MIDILRNFITKHNNYNHKKSIFFLFFFFYFSSFFFISSSFKSSYPDCSINPFTLFSTFFFSFCFSPSIDFVGLETNRDFSKKNLLVLSNRKSQINSFFRGSAINNFKSSSSSINGDLQQFLQISVIFLCSYFSIFSIFFFKILDLFSWALRAFVIGLSIYLHSIETISYSTSIRSNFHEKGQTDIYFSILKLRVLFFFLINS